MKKPFTVLKFWKLVQRENAARYLMLSLLSFVATVTLVRTFLSLTGYPQVGSGALHIAHVLWGGLILYIAAILPLIYLNRRLTTVVAILSGVGVGLFIDEVGKFITRQYDYFFPAAAPIMYVFFLLVLIYAILVNRPERKDGRVELVQAMDIIQQELYRPLEAMEKAHLEEDMHKVIATDPEPLHVELARNLLDFMRADTRLAPETSPAWWLRWLNALETRLTEPRLRRLIEAGMVVLALVTAKNPLQAWLVRYIPDAWLIKVLNFGIGRQIPGVEAPGLYTLRIVIEIVVVILLLASMVLFATGRHRLAIRIVTFALLLSLGVLDMLLFYFEQFSTILEVLFQFLLITGVLFYRRKYLDTRL